MWSRPAVHHTIWRLLLAAVWLWPAVHPAIWRLLLAAVWFLASCLPRHMVAGSSVVLASCIPRHLVAVAGISVIVAICPPRHLTAVAGSSESSCSNCHRWQDQGWDGITAVLTTSPPPSSTNGGGERWRGGRGDLLFRKARAPGQAWLLPRYAQQEVFSQHFIGRPVGRSGQLGNYIHHPVGGNCSSNLIETGGHIELRNIT